MSVLLVAQDVAPCAALDLLHKELDARRIPAKAALGFGKKADLSESLEELKALVESSSLVITGMSSINTANTEFALVCHALARGIPVGFYADTWGCAKRAPFLTVREKVSLVFVPDKNEQELARSVFSNARVVLSGNPLWEKSRYALKGRDEVRQDLRETTGGAHKLVLCPLSKDVRVNRDLLAALWCITESVVNTHGIITLHGGDTTPRADYDAAVYGNDYLSIVDERSESLIPGMDLVLNARSSVGIEAAMQGITVIELETERLSAREQEVFSGWWKLPEMYPDLVSRVAAKNLAETAEHLMRRTKWRGVVGPVPKLNSIRIMADAVKETFDQ